MIESIHQPVTVLMPVYNGEKYLREAVDSILAQTYREFEFLIINDGSTDGTRGILESYGDPRIRVMDNDENRGIVYTLNRGLKQAAHDLIARQDADDLCAPHRLQRQVEYLGKHPDVALVGSRAANIDERGSAVYGKVFDKPVGAHAIRWYMFFDNPFVHTSVMFRKNVILDRFGGYPEFRLCEDYELWSRVAREGPVTVLAECLVTQRVHSNSLIGSTKPDIGDDGYTGLDSVDVVRRNLDSVFAEPVISRIDARSFRLFAEGVTTATLVQFEGSFDALYSAYVKKYPEAESSVDFRMIVSSMLCQVAYGLLASSRMAAVRLYVKGLRIYPGLAFQLPWGRMVALAVAGDLARRVYRNLIRQ